MKDDLGNRMKDYEKSFKVNLPKRLPLLLRVDGKAFHSYTSGFNKPFDSNLVNAMLQTAKYLCENIPGAKLAYQQSDEISILVTNYDELVTQPWFNNNLQKICSVVASLATAKFNQVVSNEKNELALFDCRAFILPKEEVNNYFLWRQQDAKRNSVSMFAQSKFSHKELHKKSNKDKKEMLLEKGIDWDKLSSYVRMGGCVIKKTYTNNDVVRTRWVVDDNTPDFKLVTNYVEDFVYFHKRLEG